MTTTITSTPLTPSNSTLSQHRHEAEDGVLAGLVAAVTTPPGVVAAETLSLALLWMLSLLGNLLVCVVVHRSRRIQSTTNYFVVALALGDLALSLLVVPFVATRIIAGSWKVGGVLCRLVRFVQHAVPAATVLVLTSICVDRFYTILYPLSFKVTRGTAKRMVLTSWVTAALLSLLCFYFFDTVTVSIRSHEVRGRMGGGGGSSSEEDWESSLELCPTFVLCYQNWGGVVYVLLTVTLQFLLPVLALVALYGRVLRHIGRAGRPGIGVVGGGDGGGGGGGGAGVRGGGGGRGRGGVVLGNPVPRAKVQMVRMLLVVTASTLLLLTPFYGVQLGYCLNPGRKMDAGVFIFAFWCLAASGTSKPLIYLRCNPNFRRGCKEVFCMSAMRCYRSHTYTITSASALGKKNHVGVLSATQTPNLTLNNTSNNGFFEHLNHHHHHHHPPSPPQPLTGCTDSPLRAFNRAWHVEKTVWPLNGAATSPSTYL